MAYTPQGTYFDRELSAADKAAVDAYKEQWKAAHERNDPESMAAAHAGAEAIRAAAGYSGGSDGSDYIPVASAARSESAPLTSELSSLYTAQSSAWERQAEAQRTAREAAVRKAVNALEDSRADTQAQYSDLFRQLYLDKMRSRKNLDQKLAAGGVTGGAAETVRLGYDTAYEDALRQGEQSRIDAVGAIDRAIADAKLTGDLEIANAAAKAAQEQTDAYADTLRYLIDRQDTLDAQREKYAREDAAAARRYIEQQRAAEEKEAREAEKAAEKAAKPALTVAQVNAAIKAGIRTEAVLAAYEYYYGKPYRG